MPHAVPAPSAPRTTGGAPAAPAAPAPPAAPRTLAAAYATVRARTEALCAPLEIEDYVIRTSPDVSPAKWHLAHTAWFFETFVLSPHAAGYGVRYAPRDPRYAYLFNSYYVQAGERHCRAQRGFVTRPTVREVYAYRAHVDAAMAELLARLDARDLDDPAARALRALVVLGLQHEQQHQELILTDLKHVFWMNPLRPAYAPLTTALDAPLAAVPAAPAWWTHAGGVVAIGHDASDDGAPRDGASRDGARGDAVGADHPARFAFDNETPRHRVYLHPFALGTRLVTNGDYLAFVADGGYARPTLWLSAGWDAVRAHGWEAPLYWERDGDGWQQFTLHGMRPLDPDAPVCHLSRHEADAYARWAGARLPTEAEWEVAVAAGGIGRRLAVPDGTWAPEGAPEGALEWAPVWAGRFAEAVPHQPLPAALAPDATQAFGEVWQWTASAYLPYPGFRPALGAVGEYNGKFMSDQWVLRGASVATPAAHARHTYRNFFPADTRWQFTGLRLARDVDGRPRAAHGGAGRDTGGDG